MQRIAIVACIIGAAACAGATDTGPAPVELRGQWHYTAEQTAPVRTVIDGTLSIDAQSGHSLSGSLVAHEIAPDGSRTLSGFLNGRTPDATTIEFQADLGGGARIHQGRIRGDSIVGTWYDEFAGGGAGTFKASR